LFKIFAETFGIKITEIIICDLRNGIFYAVLVCLSEQQRTIEIDCRTSDAIALAVRFGCPIYTYEHVLQSASVMMEDTNDNAKKQERTTSAPVKNETPKRAPGMLSGLTVNELQHLLKVVLEQEDYIKAAAIRDEINRRKR
jgi:bifunctional DNase/RNase